MMALRIVAAAVFLLLISGCQTVKNEASPSPLTAAAVDNATPVDEYYETRQRMVDEQLLTRDINSEAVIAVMRRVPRHEFVPKQLQKNAYDDNPLPIGFGQTISQPYIVALMTQELQLNEDAKVLEVGTGSGYQAAVLAEMVKEVYTMEIIPELAAAADNRLKERGYKNVNAKNADGYFGWSEHEPFDAIMITAAVNHVPPPLLKQLKDGGRLILPLGSTTQFQTLTLITKQNNRTESRFITTVRFVPLTGKAQEAQIS